MLLRSAGPVFLAVLLLSALAVAGGSDPFVDLPERADASAPLLLRGAVQNLGKAEVDTIYLYGGRDRSDGDFQHDYWSSFPEDEGWLTHDLTQHTVSLWHISEFNAANLDTNMSPNRAMWCGEDMLACSEEDSAGGYSNNSNEYLDWHGIVPNIAASTIVRVTASLNFDVEEDYDFLYLEVETEFGMEVMGTWTGSNLVEGVFEAVEVDVQFSVPPADYVGAGGDQVHLRWHFQADSGWSDSDCLYPTVGATQLDNITVEFGGVPWAIDDFQPGSWVNWHVAFPPAVGDFSRAWIALNDLDPCKSNGTPQWAFVDDGLSVDGTGGTTCTTWCYGPQGYTINSEGGLAGPEFHLHNEIWSPPIAWAGSLYDGGVFAFDGYRHELLNADSPGIFYVWHIRSTADPAGVDGWTGWMDRNFVYYGGPDYLRHEEDITDLLVPGRTFVQMGIGVMELGYVWGYEGLDASPAPYFDNTALLAYEFAGPAIAGREIEVAQDNFPEIGVLDLASPGANSVRFDMAMNISPQEHLRNDPGDSLVFTVAAVRQGSILADRPKIHYKVKRNPIFDGYRTSGLPAEGWVYGDSIRTATGSIIPDKFAFDLPDTGFLFPGDVVHYFISAEDDLLGDHAVTFLPGDTTGFSLFPGDVGYQPMRYPSAFIMRALPTLHDLAGDQPPILIWNDFGGRGGENEWFFALATLGYEEHVDYDIYYTNGPSSGVGNGLGGRATAFQIQGYETMLYTAGDLSVMTISNGSFENDAGDDISTLDGWLRFPNRNLLISGDDVVSDLAQYAAGATFLSNWLPVSLTSNDIRPLIDMQANAEVAPLDGNPVFGAVDRWTAYGGCLRYNTFDAVEENATCISLAEFAAPDTSLGQYTYSAAILNQEPVYGADIIYLPYDFMYVYNPYSQPPPVSTIATRTWVLQDILLFFGRTPSGTPLTGVTPDVGQGELRVQGYPNPFNPTTRIAYDMPARGRIEIRIHNLRGQLVKTLLEAEIDQGAGFVTWDGTDATGKSVSSGTYFCSTRALGKSVVVKLALIK